VNPEKERKKERKKDRFDDAEKPPIYRARRRDNRKIVIFSVCLEPN
jgi:hypothetical protein